MELRRAFGGGRSLNQCARSGTKLRPKRCSSAAMKGGGSPAVRASSEARSKEAAESR